MLGRNGDRLISWPPISSSSSAFVMNGITRVSQATSEAMKTAIWPAMSLIASSACSLSSPSARRICWAIRSSPSRRHSSAISAACCAPRISLGTSSRLACSYCCSAVHAVARDLRLQLLRLGAAALLEQLEERLRRPAARGVGGDRRELAVVVLQRVLALAVAARVHEEQQQEQHEDAADERDPAADQKRLGICCGDAAAGRARSARPRGPAGLVVLVEEGQGWKFVSSGCGAISPHLVDPLEGSSNTNPRGGTARKGPGRARRRGFGWTSPRSRAARSSPAATGSAARLGSGGFGTVYAAHDERLDRHVALKLIPAHGPAPERSQREALAAARLHHPGIVAVYDAGDDGDGRYLVSELVRGRTLDALERDGALSDRDVLRVGLALAEALGHAHERGVIHRDVKPQNVIVPDEAHVAAKLTDFGVAHLAGDEPLTRTGDVVGTLAYMAPEQAAGERVDERADLYALALVLYEALAGANPVRGPSPAATARLVGTVLPALRSRRRDLPAGAVRRARPRAGARSRGARHARRAGRARSRTRCPRSPTTAARSPRTRSSGRPPAAAARPRGRRAGRRGPDRAALAAAADPPRWAATSAGAAASDLLVAPLTGAAAAFLLVALFPRVGWLIAAAGCVAALAGPWPEAAALVAAAAVVPPLLLRRRGLTWSLPAAAPALGLAGLAGAYPAVAGRVRGVWARAALGAAGLWWLLLAEPLLDREIALGTPPGERRRRARGARRRPACCCSRRCGRPPRSCCRGWCAAARSRSTSSPPPPGPPRWPPRPPPWPAGPASPSRAGSPPARSWRACWR